VFLVVTVVAFGGGIRGAAAPTPRAGSQPGIPSPTTWSNPLSPIDFPDPSILHVGITYYAFSTGSGPNNVTEMATSNPASWPDLFSETTDALPTPGSWAAVSPLVTVWAPSVIGVGNVFYLFYAAYDPSIGTRCIGVATSVRPAGPYIDANPAPMVCQPALGGSIDPDAFTDTEGNLYLVWKSDAHSGTPPATLWSAPMVVTPTGASLTAVPIALLSVDQVWESTIENPFMLLTNGSYDLLFSGGDYDSTSYATGYAICSGPLGPCVEPGFGPILSTTAAVAGPGGASVFEDASGQEWLVYAAFASSAVGYERGGVRSLRFEPLCVARGLVTVIGPSTGPSTFDPTDPSTLDSSCDAPRAARIGRTGASRSPA
jgi:beta-xylosidase